MDGGVESGLVWASDLVEDKVFCVDEIETGF